MRVSSTPRPFGSIVSVSGILDHPLSRADTVSRSRGMNRPSCASMSAQRGRGECRVPNAPAASRGKMKTTRVSHHRSTRIARHSRTRWFNGLPRALPGDQALLTPSPADYRRLDADLEASGPHAFAVRDRRIRQSAVSRPPHPAPNVRDDRETPLLSGTGC
jgi:hypothetical protein